MKKLFILSAVAALIASCGSGGDKKEPATADPKTETPAAPADDLSSNPVYQKGLALISDSKNLCLTCHKIDEKLTGPAYREVANKYENTEANVAMLTDKVIKGGKGVWGEIAMPPNTTISKEDAESIVKYILLLKK